MNRRSLLLCIVSTAAALLLLFLLRRPVAGVEEQITALKYQIRGNQKADTSIVLVYIDNDAIRTLGWPVRRNFYALMVKALSELHVRAVGLEVMFEERKPEYPEYDDLLAGVVGSANNVVVTAYFDSLGSPGDAQLPDSATPAAFLFPGVPGPVPAGSRLHLPFDSLFAHAAGVGHLNLENASDLPVFISSGDAMVPSFDAEILRVAAGQSRSSVVFDGTALMIGGKHLANGLQEGVAVLDYPGTMASFTAYPFLEVLKSYDALRVERHAGIPVERLKGKIVVVGVIAEGRSQFLGTPVDARLPSLAVHGAFLDNALRSGFARPAGNWLVALLCVLAGFGCAAAMLSLEHPWNGVIAFGSLAGIGILSYILFAAARYLLPELSPILVGGATAVVALFYRHRLVKEEVDALQGEKEMITRGLKDQEAKVAVLERELASLEGAKSSIRIAELLEEIRRAKLEIRALTSKADDLEEYRAVPGVADGAPEVFEGMVYGAQGKMQPVIAFVRKIAGSGASVLIMGESGTGKELIARAIHTLSGRAAGPFVAVHCGALAESLLESELFGHERGAFTGAVKDKPGRFELADGGTIFLDEIGDVSDGFQLKLLRVLQEGELERVGGTKTRKVDVRVLAATNKDLKEQVALGRFREDLYYRLNVLTVMLPPLRERGEDIPPLVGHYLQREGGGLLVSKVVMDALRSYRWPGNVRELESVITRASLLTKAEKRSMITLRDINEEVSAEMVRGGPLQDEILDLLRKKAFSRSAIAESADELGGLNRGTVAEYFRGECLKAFAENQFDIGRAVRHIALSPDPETHQRVRKKVLEYLGNISEAIDTSQPWETSRASLRPKAKNLPQRYHAHLEQVAEAYFRGLWKMGDS